MTYEILYYNDTVAEDIANLPMPLGVRYVALTRRMQNVGGNLGMPHTKAVDKGLFELRLKADKQIARVFYCTIVGKRIVMLHTFVKKTQKIPKKELDIAKQRLNEVKQNDNP